MKKITARQVVTTGGSTQTVGAANDPGSGDALALLTHTHGHGAQPIGDGTNHALATNQYAGFIAPAEKTKLAQVGSYYDALLMAIAQATGLRMVRAATTGNVSTSAAPNVVDGVSLAVDDRVLIRANTAPSQNGVWRVASLGTGSNGSWTRAPEFDDVSEVVSGVIIFAAEGATYARTAFQLTTPDPIAVTATDLTFTALTNNTGTAPLRVGFGLNKLYNTVGVVTGAATALSPASINAEGSGTTLARADHSHAIPTGTTNTTFCIGNDSRLSDDRTTGAIRSSGGTVALSTTVPTANQVLMASSGTAASWQTLSTVSPARQIIAGTGLTGGGDLSADRTLAVSYGSASGTAAQGNDSRLSDDRTASAIRTASGIISVSAATQPSAAGLVLTTTGTGTTATWQTPTASVPTSRQIISGTGLTGGGDLTADRTLTVSYGSATGTAAQGNDSRLSDDRTSGVLRTASGIVTISGATQPSAAGMVLTTTGTGTTASWATPAASVPPTRAIAAGTGLTGGGDLSADRTLAVAYGTTGTTAAAGNDSRLSDDRTSGVLRTASGIVTISAATQPSASGMVLTTTGTGTTATWQTPAASVPTSRQIAAGTGLSGGGDLSADRTLAVSYGTAAGTAAQGNDTRITSAVANTRSIIAGTGLTGGGDLSADRTLAVSFGSGASQAVAGNDTRLTNDRTAGVLRTASGIVTISAAAQPTSGQVLAAGSDGTTATWVTLSSLYVPTSRQITAGTGLTGGGDLTADRTLAVSFGSGASQAVAGNDSRLSDDRTSGVLRTASGVVTVSAATQPSAAGLVLTTTGTGTTAVWQASTDAPASRQIIAGTGLTGGGDLTADRTLAVSYGTATGTSAQGNDSRLSDDRTSGVLRTATGTVSIAASTQPSSVGLILMTTGTGTTATWQSPAYVLPSRQINSGTGLTGGGDLSANRTLAVSYGTATGTAAQGNDSRLSDDRTALALRTATATVSVSAATQPSAAGLVLTTTGTGTTATWQTPAVPATRAINSGTGLSGGGDLSADRTLAVSYGTAAGTAAQGNDSRITSAVANTRSVIAGTGLTGGGDLTADRTLAVSYGTAAGTAAQGNDSRITSAVANTRSIIAGTGLTGGGDLTADRTLAVAYGTTSTTACVGNDSRLSDDRIAYALRTTSSGIVFINSSAQPAGVGQALITTQGGSTAYAAWKYIDQFLYADYQWGSNISSMTGLTILGIDYAAGTRMLLTGQTTASQNGIWIMASGAWTRAIDMPAGMVLKPGYVVYQNLYNNGGFTDAWYLNTLTTKIVGTDDLPWLTNNPSATTSMKGLMSATDKYAVAGAGNIQHGGVYFRSALPPMGNTTFTPTTNVVYWVYIGSVARDTLIKAITTWVLTAGAGTSTAEFYLGVAAAPNGGSQSMTVRGKYTCVNTDSFQSFNSTGMKNSVASSGLGYVYAGEQAWIGLRVAMATTQPGLIALYGDHYKGLVVQYTGAPASGATVTCTALGLAMPMAPDLMAASY